MTDPRIAALAEALDAVTYPDARDGYGFDGDIREFAAAILAALDAAGWTVVRAEAGTRLVRVGYDLEQFGARTADGRLQTAEWREPLDDGTYEPLFTATDDGMTLLTTAELARLRAIEEAARDLPSLLREAIEVVHQTDSLRSHADPNDHTGWNLHGIETCTDPICVEGLVAEAALREALAGGARRLGLGNRARPRHRGGKDAMSDHLPAVCCRDHAAMAALPLIRENGDARVAAERERIMAEVKALPTLVLPTGTYVDVESVFEAIEP